MNIHLSNYGAGFPLVFFHGWGFDSQIWISLMPQLMLNYQVILVDLPGFGQSPIMDWTEFKAQLLSQLPQQFAVIGWSMGGLYATRMALEESSRVSFLVNIASSPCFFLDKTWPGLSKAVFAEFYQKLLADPHVTLNEFIKLQTGKNEFTPRLGYPPSTAGLKLGIEVLADWDFRAELKHFARPACYMFGRFDAIVPIQTMQVMQYIYPDFKYIFFNRAAHMPFLSHRDLFIDEIKDFIK